MQLKIISRFKENSARIFSLAVFVIYCLPFALIAMFAVPQGDDFNAMFQVREYIEATGKGLFETAGHITVDAYLNWQGTYLGYLLSSLLIYPAFLIGGLKAYSLMCVVQVILFFCVLCIFCFILKIKAITSLNVYCIW